MAGKGEKPELIVNGKRLDGRGFGDLRKIKIESWVLKNADGSASIEWGNNKIIAAVYGPKEALPKHTSDPERAVIKCRYAMAPFSSLEEHGSSRPSRRSTEISKVTKEVFENVIFLEEMPGGEIDIFIEVLQSDGGTRAAGITAASVALAAAGIPMRDLPYAVSVGKAGGHMIVDLDKIEDNYSDADVPIAISPRNGEVLLFQMDGELTKKDIDEAYSLAIKAGEAISKMQKDALLEHYRIGMDRYRQA